MILYVALYVYSYNEKVLTDAVDHGWMHSSCCHLPSRKHWNYISRLCGFCSARTWRALIRKSVFWNLI